MIAIMDTSDSLLSIVITVTIAVTVITMNVNVFERALTRARVRAFKLLESSRLSKISFFSSFLTTATLISNVNDNQSEMLLRN